jgi:hypothetical protein
MFHIAIHPDLSKPSPAALAYILRHKELWPPGFEFDYSDCCYCAMGLADQLWQIPCGSGDYSVCRGTAVALGISHESAIHIFTLRQKRPGNFTPEAIAADLEAL